MLRRSLVFCIIFFVLLIGNFRSSDSDSIPYVEDSVVERLLLLLDNYNVRVILNIIARCEGTSLKMKSLWEPVAAEDYTICVGYDRMNTFDYHPSEKGFIKQISVSSSTIKSTASGRYQFLFRTWKRVMQALQITSLERRFSPLLKKLYGRCPYWYENHKSLFKSYRDLTRQQFNPFLQDLGAVYLLHEQGALDYIVSGNLKHVMKEIAKVWASFPKDRTNASFYPPQRAHSYEKILKEFEDAQKVKQRYKVQIVM